MVPLLHARRVCEWPTTVAQNQGQGASKSARDPVNEDRHLNLNLCFQVGLMKEKYDHRVLLKHLPSDLRVFLEHIQVRTLSTVHPINLGMEFRLGSEISQELNHFFDPSYNYNIY